MLSRRDLQKKFYFIGVGGVSMSALARMVAYFGGSVFGSDAVQSKIFDALRADGVVVFVGVDGDRETLKEADFVVYTDAITEAHPELKTALSMQKKIFSRGEFLGEVARLFDRVIAFAGSHGKTTATAMCAHVLQSARVPFTAHIGGEDLTLSGFYASGTEYLVTEVCEYKKNLLKIVPTVSVLLNADKDHLECYQSEEELFSSFERYLRLGTVAIVNADDQNTVKRWGQVSFGVKNRQADYQAKKVRGRAEKYSFSVYERGKFLCRVRLNVVGRCHIYNALAVVASLRFFGFSGEDLSRGLSVFQGVSRRFERVGTIQGAPVVCDYAHHPNELISTILTAQKLAKKRALFIFQPHTYSRTRLLFEEFCKCFESLEHLLIFKTYSARERYDERGCAKRLSNALKNSVYAESAREVKAWLFSNLQKGDAVFFLGAGDVYALAKFLVDDVGCGTHSVHAETF